MSTRTPIATRWVYASLIGNPADHDMTWQLRQATTTDCAAIQALIARSIRGLGARDYSAETIDAALQGAFGLDTQLIADGTYFVVEEADRLLGCGGWSFRRTLFGSDARAGRDAGK